MATKQRRQKDGEAYKDDTVEEPCHGCGVVQEMDVYVQQFQDSAPSHFTKGECPVCGNDHMKNPPW